MEGSQAKTVNIKAEINKRVWHIAAGDSWVEEIAQSSGN